MAKTTDLDGNLLEVRYERRLRRGSNNGGSIRSGHASKMERQNSSNSHREGTTITTASTAKEAKRVLEWQRTVARSVSEGSDSESSAGPRTMAIRKPQAETVVSGSTLTPQRRTPPPAAPSAPSLISQALHQQQQQAQSQSQQIHQAIPSLMRAATAPVGAMTAVYNEITSALPQEKLESSGLSTNAIIGTIMGAAAGAAIAYAMVKSEEPEKERPQLVTHFTAPVYQVPVQVPVQHQTRSVSMGQQQQPNTMGHDMGHNMLQAMRQHQPVQQVEEPAQYYSPSGLKAPSIADSGYSGSKVSRSEALKLRADGVNSQSGSRVGSLRESSHLEENYSSSPKSTHSASPSHHSSRSKAEGSHVSKSSSRHTSKLEAPRAETVFSNHSVAKSSASTSRGSEASTVKPTKSSSSKAPSKAHSVAYSETKSSHTSHSRASEKSHGAGSFHSVKSDKSKHSSSRRVPESVVGSIAGTVVPEDSVSQVGSRHSSSRRRQEVY